MEKIFRIELSNGRIFPLNTIIRCGYIAEGQNVYQVICQLPENFSDNMLNYTAIIQDNKVIELKYLSNVK